MSSRAKSGVRNGQPQNGLAQLGALREQIRRAEQEAAQQAALAQAEQEHQQREQQVFVHTVAHTVGRVTPLPPSGRVSLTPPPLPATARQRERDEQAALRSSLSDEFDVETLLEADDTLSFRRPPIGPDVLRKLRRGDWAIQAQLDLHGLNRDDARDRLADFLRVAVQRGVRCVRIVHGKGHGSPGKTPVLKGRVHRWLAQRLEVVAFVQARPADGGAGALIVLLAGS